MSIYLDNNATTHLSTSVKHRLHDVINLSPGNPESPHSDGEYARSIIETCRLQIAETLNAQDDQIIFTGSGSESNSFIINDLNNQLMKRGTLRILTSELEHSSLQSGFNALRHNGADIVYIPITPLGIVDLKILREEMKNGADCLVFQWVNSITGIVQPIESIAKLANEESATLHVDAAQAYGRFPIDVETITFDSLTITCHKIHGPQGVAALFLRKPQSYGSFVLGGQQEKGLRGGTHNVIGIAGFGQAVKDRFDSIDNICEKILSLRKTFEELLLETIPEIIIQGKSVQRVINTACVTFPEADGLALMAALDQEGIICSQTSACRSRKPEPSPALTAMGLSEEDAYATLRFSLSQINTYEEISEAVQIISRIFQKHKKKERFSI